MATQSGFSEIAKSPVIKSLTVVCFCGSSAHLDSNAKMYNGREYGNGMVWLCDRWPECDGAVGTHPDGRPLGNLIDQPTRKYRRAVHAAIDPLWQHQNRSKKKARGSVYGWLCKIMGMTPDECHVGNWDADTCIEALEKMALRPYKLQRQEVGNDLLTTDLKLPLELSDAPSSPPEKNKL